MTVLALSDYRRFTDTASQARVLELVEWLYKSTSLHRDGERWTAPRLVAMAEKLCLSTSTIQRALNWLSARGLIVIKKMMWNRSPRLYLQSLFELKCNLTDGTVGTVNSHGGNSIKNTLKENTSNSNLSATTADEEEQVVFNSSEKEKKVSPLPPSTRLRGSMDGAKTRLANRQHENPPNHDKTATQVAHDWNKLLIANGDKPFTVDPKTVRMIKLAAKRFTKGGRVLIDDLPQVIDFWSQFAPKDCGPNAVPWAVRRAAPKWFERCTILGNSEKLIVPPVLTKPKPVIQKPYAYMSISEKMKHDKKMNGKKVL